MTVEGVPLVLNAGDMTHLLLDALLIMMALMVRHLLKRLQQLEDLVEKLEQDVFRLMLELTKSK